jgi:hypothetical protein
MNILPLLSNANAPWRDTVLSSSRTSVAIRTPTWCHRHPYAASAKDQETSDTQLANELYVRPDDRWEANDIAKLCPDVVDLLAGAAGQVCQQLQRNLPLAVS